jgi:capsid assembly protease
MHEPKLRAMCEYLSGRVLSIEGLARTRASGPDTVNNVSVVGLKGVITPGPSLLAMLFGAGGGGIEGFLADMRTAIGDPDTRAVIMDIDSPGGMVDLVPEAASELRAMRDEGGKPIVAVASTAAASAAYWLAAQAHELVVTPSGEVGSVGVYTVHRDMSEAFEREGVRHTLVSAGSRKVEGNPYTALEPEAQAAMQQDVDDYYEMFVADVAKGRGVEMPSLDGLAFGGGRSYLARRAVSMGLADKVATLPETIRRLSSSRSRVKQLAGPAQYTKDQRLRLLDALTSR